MRDLNKYKGILPAFYACYDDNGEISVERTKALVRYFIGKGVKGLYVGGSSGECIYQNVAERKLALGAVMEEARGKLTIIAHVACNSTRDSVELAKHAESLGVDAIAAIPPIYFHLPDYANAEYWNTISAAAPNTDFVIYNIPQLAGVALNENLFKTMLENPRIIGVKNSSLNVQDILKWKHIGGDDCIVFNGPDEQFVCGRLMGAEAGIGGTYGAMPDVYVKLEELVRTGDVDQARKLQKEVDLIIYRLCSAHGNMYAVIKEVLRQNENLDIGGVRSPLTNLIPEDKAVVDDCVAMIRRVRAEFC